MVNWKEVLNLDFASMLPPLEQDIGTCAFDATVSLTGKGGSIGMTTALSGGLNRARVRAMLPPFVGLVNVEAWWKAHANMTRVTLRELLQYQLDGTQKKYAGAGFDYSSGTWEVLETLGPPETYDSLTTPSPWGAGDPIFASTLPRNGGWVGMSVTFKHGAPVEAGFFNNMFGSALRGIVCPPYAHWNLTAFPAIDHTSADDDKMTQIEFDGETTNAAEQFHLGKFIVRFGDEI
jgi:hypothetical protein|tara:strand:+ start:39131 stop:39832 length:702 start_codon:yes stop_codon:yes gene_type:complete